MTDELHRVERFAVGLCVAVFFWPLWLMAIVVVGILWELLR